MNNSFILVFLFLGFFYLFGGVHSSEKIAAPITVESMTCSYLDANKECVMIPEGAFTVSINPQASTCSIMYESYQNKAITFTSSQSLAYIDDDNWECRGEPSPSHLYKIAGWVDSFNSGNAQHVYQMTKGTIKITIEDLDHITGPIEYRLHRKTGFENWIKHFSW